MQLPALGVSISLRTPILLGSASPRRRDILAELGLPVVVRPTATDELQHEDDSPDTYLVRVVRDKLRAAERARPLEEVACVLVADTVVVLDGQILGKPVDTEDAARLVGMLAGRTHRVSTRFAFSWVGPDGPGERALTVTSNVTMRDATPGEIRRYAETGEGLDKAGAYAVQGLGAFLVERIEGSYTNVVGLPACELVRELRNVGFLPEFPRLF